MLKVCVESSLPFNSAAGHAKLLKSVEKIADKWILAGNAVGISLVVDLLAKYDRQALA